MTRPPAPGDAHDRIQALIDVIRQAETELRALAGDQIDAVALGEQDGYLLLPRGQRQLLEREAAEREAAATLQSTLDAVPAHIALLDSQGVIKAVNESWRRFGKANGLAAGLVGLSYLETCDGATGDCSDEARDAAEGIRRVLRRETELFSLEYPCHSPDQRRWFRLMVTPVLGGSGGVVVTHVDVTARRLAEDAIRASEARLRETQRIAGLGSWNLDPVSGRLSWAGQVAEIFGVDADGCPRTVDGFLAWVHPGDRPAFKAALERALAGEIPLDIEHRIVRPDGGTRILRERGEVVADDDGRPVVLTGTVLDLTALRLSQQRGATASAFFLEAERIAQLGSWDFDVPSGRLTWSDEACRLFGTTAADFPGTFESFTAFVLPEDRPGLAQANAHVSPDAPQLEAEYRIRRADGEVRWLYERGVAIFDDAGRMIRRLGVVMDVTERREAEARLAESEMRYRRLFEHMAAGFVLFDVHVDGRGTPVDLTVLDANAGFERVTGVSRNQAIGRRLTEVVPGIERDDTDWIGIFGRVALTGEALQLEEPSQLLGRYLLANAYSPLPRQCAVTFVDVTGRKLAEQALRASEARFRAIFSAAATGMALAAADGRLLDCNDAFCRLVGHSSDDLTRTDLLSLTHPDDRETTLELLSDLLAGRRSSFVVETRYVRKDGRVVWSRVGVAPMPDPSGRPSAVIAVAEDITELKAAEAERIDLLARERAARREADTASRYFQSLFEYAPGAYLVLEAQNYDITAVSEAYLRATMTTREEILGRHIFDIFPDGPDADGDRPTHAVRQSLDRVKEFGRSDVMGVQRYPIPRPAAEGGGWEERYWSPVNTPVPGPDGRVAFIIHRVEDVTEYVKARQQGETAAQGEVLETRAQQMEADIVLRTAELKRANEELLRSQALLRIAGHAAKLGGWRLELDPERLVWSDETCAIHDRPPGHQPTLAEGLEYYLPEYRETVSAALQRTRSTGEPFEFEAQLVTAKGRRIWGRAFGEVVRTGSGEVIGLQGAFQDITSQVEAAREVDRLAARLTTTLENLSDAFFTLDQEWNFSYVNAQAEVLLARPRHELLGRNVWELFPHAVGTQFQHEYERALRDKVSVTFEEPYAPLDKWFEVRAYPSDDGLVVYFRDVTERRQQREALLASEERFRLLSRATNDAIWDWDLLTDSLWWNEGFEALFRFSREEVEPTIESWTSRIHPDDAARVVDDVHAAIEGGATAWSGEYRFLRKDGSYAFVLDRGNVIRDDTGRAVRMVGGITDLTARKEAEERLREQAALLDRAQDAILVRDLEHRVTYWNKSAERLYGWTAEEVLGRAVTELLYADTSVFQAATAHVFEHEEWVGEIQQCTKSGQVLTVEARWSLVRSDSGEPRSVLAINTDLTDRKRLEQQFLRAQRMESIGTLAGGIAHDLNNVLAPIMMAIDLLRLSYPAGGAVEILDTVEASARRGAEMVSQVLSFARGMEGQRVAVQASYLVADLVKIVKDTFPKNIALDVDVAPDLWALEADPTQLHQVLLNLCVNARDAMPDGGKITIRAGNMVIDEHYAAMNIEARVGSYVRLEVEDTGTGIPADIVERIFDPFFTTKEIGKGTGLGLSTTLAIVKSHGGFIRVYSDPGMGAKFRVYLPAAWAPTLSAASIDQLLPRGNGQTILVVDDEASIRHITQQTLETFGYRVLTAANGADAVALFAQRLADISLVLVDMMMPVMDGPSTIRALLQIAPSARIIGASGITANGKVAQASGAGVREFLPKPYTAEILLKAVARGLRDP